MKRLRSLSVLLMFASMLLALGWQVAAPVVKLGEYSFTVRSGEVGYALSYSEDGVVQMAKNRVRLLMTKPDGSYRSAGLLGPVLGRGTYEFDVSARLSSLDPAAVFAIWLYNDATKDELDVVEATRWGDLNQPNTFWFTLWRKEVKGEASVFPARAFRRYRFVLVWLEKSVSVKAYGLWEDGSQKEIGFLHSSTNIPPDFGQVRIALWIPKKGLSFPADAVARGPMYVTLDGFKFTPSP